MKNPAALVIKNILEKIWDWRFKTIRVVYSKLNRFSTHLSDNGDIMLVKFRNLVRGGASIDSHASTRCSG